MAIASRCSARMVRQSTLNFGKNHPQNPKPITPLGTPKILNNGKALYSENGLEKYGG